MGGALEGPIVRNSVGVVHIANVFLMIFKISNKYAIQVDITTSTTTTIASRVGQTYWWSAARKHTNQPDPGQSLVASERVSSRILD